MSSQSNLIKKLSTVIVGIIVAAAVIGFGVTTTSTIPDHAQIMVFPFRGEWVPMHEAALETYKDSLGENEFVSTIMIRSSWKSVKDGTFGDIKLPPKIRNMNSWTITAPRPLIIGLLFGPKQRWREDGSWIY